jgi:hypothetical protein
MIDSMLLTRWSDKDMINKDNIGQEMRDESCGKRDIVGKVPE